MWHVVRNWLTRVPVDDPVDRRNAPFVQVLFLLLGSWIPLIKLYYFFLVAFRGLQVRYQGTEMWVDASTDVLMTASAWIGFYLVRHGRFRPALVLFLVVFLGSMTVSYGVLGMVNLGSDPMPLLVLALAGQVLGRRALWVVYATVLVSLAAGVTSDGILLGHASMLATSAGKAVSRAIIYLLVVVLIDQTVAALRESLVESNLRGQALERLNVSLQHEILEHERAQEQLIHAQKLEVVGRVASGVAHDFDNVLNIVLGYAMRRERLADQGMPALLNAMEGMELAAHRALAISRKLLNFSRQDISHPEVFNVADAVRELQPMLRQLFLADVRLTVKTGEDRIPVHMDRGQFELVLLNLASNARDAMPEGGRFTVAACRSLDEDFLELTLADTGHGIPAAVAPRIFEPFYTTKPPGSGTGIGLAVVRDLVERAGGNIAVESVPGAGTTFRLKLPLALSETGIDEAALDGYQLESWTSPGLLRLASFPQSALPGRRG
ncbi:MAG TPA: ATP-binding protein [Rhodanobacter sp.]